MAWRPPALAEVFRLRHCERIAIAREVPWCEAGVAMLMLRRAIRCKPFIACCALLALSACSESEATTLGEAAADGVEDLPIPENADLRESFDSSGPYETDFREFSISERFTKEDVLAWYGRRNLDGRAWRNWTWCRDTATSSEPDIPQFVWKRGSRVLFLDVFRLASSVEEEDGDLVIRTASFRDTPDLDC